MMAGISSDRRKTVDYAAPQIERRTEIGPMLIGIPISSNLDT
jgi:hypothetical protein